MDDVSAILLAVLVGGVLAGLVRLPPLLGFLAAGFVLYPLGVQAPPALGTIADLGVTVLLFGVGLKVDLRAVVRREVWLTSSLHALVSTAVTAGLLGLLAVLGVGLAADGGLRSWLLIGFALSFSSTVFVVKVLEERGATQTLTGRLAIGVLVVQDLLAVVFLAAAEGKAPSPWALLLVLLIPAAPLLRRLLGRLGHDEMLPLYGIVLALVPGYALFSALGIKGDLGALLLGVLLAGQPRSAELAKSLFSIKDLLLVGFFVSIGLAGLPTGGELVIAAALLLVLPVQALVFVVLFYLARLRRRTAVFTATVLTNFSEFGLILVVALPDDLLDPGWAAPLAAAVAASFVLPSLVGDRPDRLVDVLRRWLPDRPNERLHADDRPLDLGDAQAVVLGMGRVGYAAHRRLTEEYGLRAIGIEADGARVGDLAADGVHVIEGDATDPRLWEELELHHVELVLLAMPAHDANLATLTRLRSHGFEGTVAAVTQFDDDLTEVLAGGADIGLQLYEGAGAELADRAVQRPPHPPSAEAGDPLHNG